MYQTAGFRRRNQLFVSWTSPHKGLQPLEGVACAFHLVFGCIVALFRNVNLQDICAATSRSSPLTFVWLYIWLVDA